MPRSSLFTIALSRSEEAELRRRAGKYKLRYFQVQRAKMILYAAEGMPNDEIAGCQAQWLNVYPSLSPTLPARKRRTDSTRLLPRRDR
jgi:hypothetical protein